MDVLAPTTMKNAAKCDTSCELHNPVSHQNFERNLHFLRGVCLFECLFIPTKKTPPQVFFRSRPFDPTRLGLNASRWNECLTRSNF